MSKLKIWPIRSQRKEKIVIKKYRPANVTEGYDFQEDFCYNCAKDMDTCSILLDAELYNVDNTGYPEEWQYNSDDQPVCTAFVG